MPPNRVLTSLALLALASPALAVDLAPPSALLAGVPVTVAVTDAAPGRPVWFLASVSGSGVTACPPQIAPTCLGIDDPIVVLGGARADAQGRATLSVRAPRAATGVSVQLQAVVLQPGGPDLSGAVTLTVLGPTLDEDGDGLSNAEEVDVHLTDPFDDDTDGDGASDGDEVLAGTDPLDDQSVPNGVPEVTSCVVTPGSPRVGDAMTATATTFDPDGDPVTVSVRWQKQIFPVWLDIPGLVDPTRPSCAAANVPPNDPDSIYNCVRGNTLRAVCTPDDGQDVGAPVASAPVVLANTPPEITNVSVNPSAPTTFDNLVATASASDADLESVTLAYTWRVNSVLVASGSSATLSFSLTAPGDEVTVEVVATDTVGAASTPVSATVTVLP